MTLLLILICTSLQFSEAFPVLYRSSKHTDHADVYGVSILPTYFTSKLTTVFSVENDETIFHRSNNKKGCVSCHKSSVVPEETIMEQEADSLRHGAYTITRQFNRSSSKFKDTTETKDLSTVPMHATYSSELPVSKNEKYIHMPPEGNKGKNMMEGQRFSTPYYTAEKENGNLDIYSTLQDTASGYIGSFTVGYVSTQEHETREEETTVIQLEDPTTIEKTAINQYSYVSSMNYEQSLGMESITSGYIPKPTYSKDTELRKHEEILHTSVKVLNKHSSTSNYNTGSTAGEIERMIDREISSNEGTKVMKDNHFSAPRLSDEGIQTVTLESFMNSSNEIYDQNFKITEHEGKTSLVSQEDNSKAKYSKLNEKSIATTQQTEINDSLMFASIFTTPAQKNSTLVTVNDAKYDISYSNRKQISTAVSKKEETYDPSSMQKHVKESHTRVLDTSFKMSTVPTKEGYSTDYNEPSTDKSGKIIQTAEQKPLLEHYRKMGKTDPRYFTMVDRDQVRDVEYLEATESENQLDIETLNTSSNKSNNSDERVEVGMSKDNAIMLTSEELKITGEQNNYMSLSYDYNNRTEVNPTSRNNMTQSNTNLEIKEQGMKPVHSGGYYPDATEKLEVTELLTTAPDVHTTVKQDYNSHITNQTAREELHPGRLQNVTLAPNAQEEDIENFEIIEREEELGLATTTISPFSRSGGRKGKVGTESVAQRRTESMTVAPNRYDELDTNENGDRRHNSTMELRRKEKPRKHFETEKLEERSKPGNLNSNLRIKEGGSKNRGEKGTKISDSQAVTASKFVKIVKIKKQKSAVVSEQREETNKTRNMKHLKLHSRIMQINGTGLVSNLTKIMKQKKEKYNVTGEEQRKMYQNKNLRKSEFHGNASNFTKIMKVRTMKNAFKDKSRKEALTDESLGRRKIDGKTIQEQNSVTIFIKTRKVRKPKQILTTKGRDGADKTGSMSKLKLSKKLQDQRRQHSAATVSTFMKIRRHKKQKNTLKYSGTEEARRTEEPEYLEPVVKKNSSLYQFPRKVPGMDLKYVDLPLGHELSISQPREQKVGKLKETNGNVKGSGNERHFHFQRKDRNILAKKENVSTNEKTEEGIYKDALMLRLNQQKSRKEDKNDYTKNQSEKISPYLTNMKKPQRRRDMLLRITKKIKIPRFALDRVKNTVFVKGKKLVNIWPQKTTTLFVPITVPYQNRFSKIQDQSKSIGVAQNVTKSKIFRNTQYWDSEKESPEKSMDLYLPTVASYHNRFPDNQQRKKLNRYPLKIHVPTLFTVPKATEYIPSVENTYLTRFSKIPKVMKYTKTGVTKPMSMLFTIWKGRKHNVETNKSTSLALTEQTPILFTNTQNWNSEMAGPEKTNDLFIPTTIHYQSRFLKKQQRKYIRRYPLKMPIPTSFTKSKSRDSINAAANNYESRFHERPKEMMSSKFAAGFFYPITVANETKLFDVPVSKRTDSTVLGPTIPIPLPFTKIKKPKLKAMNPTVSFSTITIFRQNKFENFPDGNKRRQTTVTSHIPRMCTKCQDRVFKELPPKTVGPFIPKRSYVSEFHEMSTQNEKYRPAIVLPLFRKRIGQGRTNEMTTQITELFYTVTHAYQRKQQDAQTNRRHGQESADEITTQEMELFYPETHSGEIKEKVAQTTSKLTMDDITVPVFSFIPKSKDKELRRKWPLKATTPPTYSHETTFGRFGQESTNEMTTQEMELFYPETHSGQTKEQVVQTTRKLTIDDITKPVFSFIPKSKEKKLRRKRPLKTTTPPTYSDETTFGITTKQDRRTKLPVTEAHFMFRQFPVQTTKCTVVYTTDKLMDKTTKNEIQDSPEVTCPATWYEVQELTCPVLWTTPDLETDSVSDSSTDDVYDDRSSSILTSDNSHTTEWSRLGSTPSDLEAYAPTSTPPEFHTNWSSTTAVNIDTKLPIWNVSQFTTEGVYTRTDGLIFALSTNTSPFPDSLLSNGTSISSLSSPVSTPIPFEITLYTHQEGSTELVEESVNPSFTDDSNNTDHYFDTEVSNTNGPQFISKTLVVGTDDLILSSSLKTSLISNSLSSPAETISISKAPTTPLTDEISESSNTNHYFDTEASNINIPPSASKTLVVGTGDLIVSSSINKSLISNSLSSHGETISTSNSTVSTPIPPEITSYTHQEIGRELVEERVNSFATDESSNTDHYFETEVSNTNVPQSVSKTLVVGTDDLILSSSINTSLISNLLSSPGETISTLNSPVSTPIPPKITLYTHQKIGRELVEERVKSFVTDESSNTDYYLETEVSNTNVPQSVSKTLVVGTDYLIISSSIKKSVMTNSLSSFGESISTSKSPTTTPLTDEITESSNADHYFDTEVSNTNVPHSVSKTLVVGTDDLIVSSSINKSLISNSLSSTGETISPSKSPTTTPLTDEITSTTSHAAHSAHVVGEGLSGTSATWSLGSIPSASNLSSLSTPSLEITKRRTCQRLLKTSPADSVSRVIPEPFLTLHPTSRRRLKTTTPSPA